MTLHCTNLACQRNGRRIFQNLSLRVDAQQLLELRGPNGVGKSSLLRVIAGLVPKTEGTVAWQDQPEVSPHCHYIGHLDGLKSALTVAENLQFWASMLGGRDISSALKAFALDGLADQPVQLLSAGQKRRTALAKLICAKRPIWLLDEPATALDQQSRRHLNVLMQTHLNEGGLILMATHEDVGLTPHMTLTMGDAT
jgi:heme exporter protein A